MCASWWHGELHDKSVWILLGKEKGIFLVDEIFFPFGDYNEVVVAVVVGVAVSGGVIITVWWQLMILSWASFTNDRSRSSGGSSNDHDSIYFFSGNANVGKNISSIRRSLVHIFFGSSVQENKEDGVLIMTMMTWYELLIRRWWRHCWWWWRKNRRECH